MGTGKTVRTDSVPVFPGFFLVFPVETVFGPENWYTVPVGRPVFNPRDPFLGANWAACMLKPVSCPAVMLLIAGCLLNIERRPDFEMPLPVA